MTPTKSSEAFYIILSGLVSAAALSISLPPVLKLFFGLLLVFVLPGYAITLALFIRVSLRIFERICLILGTSLAVVVTGGFLLHLLGAGLRSETWLLFLSFVTVAAGGIAYIRSGVYEKKGCRFPSFSVTQVMLLGYASVIMIFSIFLSRFSEARYQQSAFSFTQLWSQCAALETRDVLILSLRSNEENDMNYRLVLLNGEQILNQWDGIHLEPDQQWDTAVILPEATGESQSLEARLYQAGNESQAYRQISIDQQATGICK